MKTFVTAIVIIAAAGLHAAKQPPVSKIPVLVRSVAATGGFTDPDKGRSDSVKDLTRQIKDASKVLRIVTTEEQATIVLEVLSRGNGIDQGPALTPFGGPTPKHGSLTVRLTTGTFTADFTGTGGVTGAVSGYRRAAYEVVKQLEKWVKENRERLQ